MKRYSFFQYAFFSSTILYNLYSPRNLKQNYIWLKICNDDRSISESSLQVLLPCKLASACKSNQPSGTMPKLLAPFFQMWNRLSLQDRRRKFELEAAKNSSKISSRSATTMWYPKAALAKIPISSWITITFLAPKNRSMFSKDSALSTQAYRGEKEVQQVEGVSTKKR